MGRLIPPHDVIPYDGFMKQGESRGVALVGNPTLWRVQTWMLAGQVTTHSVTFWKSVLFTII